MEGLLRNKCGYKGYMTYWDWTIGRSDTRREYHLNILNMITDMMFYEIHTTSSILLFSTPILRLDLGRFQTPAPISPSLTGPFVIPSVLTP